MNKTIFLLIAILFLGCEQKEPFSNAPITYKVSGISGIGTGTNNDVDVFVSSNPFYEYARIHVRANQESRVSISFSNPDGDLQKAVDDYPIDNGRYDFLMNFSGHKPGVYLCEVVVSDFVDRFELVKAY